MKLILLSILTISLAVDTAQEYFTLPPHFQTPKPGIYTTEKSVYLPSEAPMHYFPIKDMDKLQFQYLPPTGTKSQAPYPKPFPIMVTSTLLPSLEANVDDEEDDDKKLTPAQSYFDNRANYTEKKIPKQVTQMRDLKLIPRSFNYQQPIDRIDMKIPYQFPGSIEQTHPKTVTQVTPTRSVTISAETRNDHEADQIKSGNFPIPQYLPLPGYFISSTTETAIPILRLSNEMDLDGSFSYEALGADQTHYVQHSRMENAGTDKQEQVVEGSYSYVGDNGQTYTVHYIADSNGFRATGDHLPVAPPIPEIIQRAVQYNLAEDAKKPQNLQSWNEENRHKISDSDKNNRYNHLHPQNLFTGRTPESFSFNFGQELTPQNNIAVATTVQSPVKLNNDFIQDQTNTIISPTISPQITFLASQGAHLPSVNMPHQTIARMFTADKSTMPQLVNYEAAMKESDQESNKALWRWQYGLNPDTNKTPDKNTISRSFGEDDDIMINFDDMTPEQYTDMVKTHIEPNKKEQSNFSYKKYPLTEIKNSNQQQDFQQYSDIYTTKNKKNDNTTDSSTENVTPVNQYNTWYHSSPATVNIEYTRAVNDTISPVSNKDNSLNDRTKLITYRQFVPSSQTVTQSYNYQNENHKSTSTQNLHSESLDDRHLMVFPLDHNNGLPNSEWSNMNHIEKQYVSSTTYRPIELSNNGNSNKFNDFVVPSKNKDFKPINESKSDINKEHHNEYATAISFENELSDNMFLQSVFNKKKIEPNVLNKSINDIKNQYVPKSVKHLVLEKSANKLIPAVKPITSIKDSKMKPLDMSEIMNFINAKNQFESIKIKPKNQIMLSNYNEKTESPFIPIEHTIDNADYQETLEPNKQAFQNFQYQDELRGMIKNYKVLHRRGSTIIKERDLDQLKRNSNPTSFRQMQAVNLPPLGRAGPSMKSYLPPVYA